MHHVDVRHGAATDVGFVRVVNEDALLAAPPVFVVADGMGGHSGGDVASRIVVEEFARLSREFDPRRGPELVADTFARAQARIVSYGDHHRAAQPGWHAGTTAVAALLVEDSGQTKWLLANLGDSRAYKLSEKGLDQVTVDHSVVQELIDARQITADEAAVHPERHVITRALGSPEGVHPDFFLLPLSAVERLLLCTDGISGMIDDGAIEHILRTEVDPDEAAEALVKAALEAGGRDNATAIVVDVVGLVDADHDTLQFRRGLDTQLGGQR